MWMVRNHQITANLFQHVPEDLENYSDLGLRIPFDVQLQYGGALNKSSYPDPEANQNDMNSHDPEIGTMIQRLSKGELGPEEQKRLARAQSMQALLRSDNQGRDLDGTKNYRYRYTYEMPADRAKRFAATTTACPASGVVGRNTDSSTLALQECGAEDIDAVMESMESSGGPSFPSSNGIGVPPLAALSSTEWHNHTASSANSHGQDTTMYDFTTTDANFDDINFDEMLNMPLDESVDLGDFGIGHDVVRDTPL